MIQHWIDLIKPHVSRKRLDEAMTALTREQLQEAFSRFAKGESYTQVSRATKAPRKHVFELYRGVLRATAAHCHTSALIRDRIVAARTRKAPDPNARFGGSRCVHRGPDNAPLEVICMAIDGDLRVSGTL